MKPIIKWAGGKQKLLSQILPHIPYEYDWYHEPFFGGGALFWALQPKKAIIFDTNWELINFYKQVRNDLPLFLKEVDKFKIITEQLFYEMRDLDRVMSYSSRPDLKKAARFLFLNKTCFNGLYRVNKQGQFNTPFGKYKNPKIYDLQLMKNAFHILNKPNRISIQCMSFEGALKATKGDFVYLDPPYYPVKKDSFVAYGKDVVIEKLTKEVKAVCEKLTNKGVKWLLSNSYCDFTLDLFSDCGKLIEIEARRYINSSGTGRGSIKEILVKNY